MVNPNDPAADYPSNRTVSVTALGPRSEVLEGTTLMDSSEKYPRSGKLNERDTTQRPGAAGASGGHAGMAISCQSLARSWDLHPERENLSWG
jgi:hypothetical protein